MKKIVGVMLIKNEDLYIERVINNVIDFCDELMVLENYSSDKTFEIISILAEKTSKIKIIRVTDALDTHKYIEPYVRTDTWIFRIDGDELYDSNRLLSLKVDLLSGQYDSWLTIGCPCLNVERLDLFKKTATGHYGRMTSFVNFSLFESWHEKGERLHGSNKIYSTSFDNSKMKYTGFIDKGFPGSELRCLHLCFIKRSSLGSDNEGRLNPGEAKYPFPLLVSFVRNIFTGKLSFSSFYKNATYKRGALVSVDASDFLR